MIMKRLQLWVIALLALPFVSTAQELTKPEQTEFWEPQPRVVVPANEIGKAPSDATILFDGKSLTNWETVKDGSLVKWKLEDGAMTVVRGAGSIRTKQSFGSFQLHIEWRSPMEPDSLKSQAKGNSGIFLQDRYEVQVLNNYKNQTYVNGQAGSIYKQTPPLVNACSPMGQWNTYDIIYTAPTFRKNGSMEKPPYVTVLHNGIIVQNHTEIQGTTEYIGPPKIKAHGNGPIQLQDHGNAVSYRNIWIREL
jgi:hypothetical protein